MKGVENMLDAVYRFLKDNDPEEFGCACVPNVCDTCMERNRQATLRAAIEPYEDMVRRKNEERM